MEIKKYQIGDTIYEFVCEEWETSQAWGHKATLLKNGEELNSRKVRYYNRTWESYRFQSVMCGCVRDLQEKERANALETFKFQNGYSRMTPKRMEEFEKYIEMGSTYGLLKDLNTLIDML